MATRLVTHCAAALICVALAVGMVSGCGPRFDTPYPDGRIDRSKPAGGTAGSSTLTVPSIDSRTANNALVQVPGGNPADVAPVVSCSDIHRLGIMLGENELAAKYDRAQPERISGITADDRFKSLAVYLKGLGLTPESQPVRVTVFVEDDIPWTLTGGLLRLLRQEGYRSISLADAASGAATFM